MEDRGIAMGDRSAREALSALVDTGYMEKIDGDPNRYLITEKGKSAHDADTSAEPVIVYAVSISEAALDGWWLSCSEEIKAELFNYFYEEMGGVASSESEQ